jgi:2-polyprenyl-3-methyl-5-hydroxy-6-metoxy-1,4-benzoquinol methylase
MVPAIIDFVARAKDRFALHSGRVLEVGSANINGTVRDLFSDAIEYIGVDQAACKGVDRILNAHDLVEHFGVNCFDTVICCEMLEHDPRPWVTIPQLHSVLKLGGTLIVSTPTFGFPLHRHPRDYWRFGEDAYREFIFASMHILHLEEVLSIDMAPIICCVGYKQSNLLR